MQTPESPSSPASSNNSSVRSPGGLSGPASSAISPRAWCVVFLCGLAGMLFYMDRETLSVLKTTLKETMGWSDTDYSWLVGAFMACYTGCYLFTGRWIDRWGTRRCMTFFMALMSVAMIIAGAAQGFGQMLLSRAVLGVAEAGVMPAIMVAIYAWFSPERRGIASTVKEPMYVIGQIAATPVAALLAKYWDWHWAFFVPGIFGLFVAAAWWFTDRKECQVPGSAANGASVPKTNASGLEASSPEDTAPVRYRDVLKRRELWGVIAARLVSDPVWFFFIYWEPGYLREKLGMSLEELAQVGWIPKAIATVTLIALGFGSDRLISRLKWQPARSRRVILQILAGLGPVLFVLPFVHNHAMAITLLCFVRIMMVVWLNFTNLLMADLVPVKLIGTAVALMSAFGAATSLVANLFVGPILDKFGYGVVFAVGACLHPFAALILWRCYGRPSQQTTAN